MQKIEQIIGSRYQIIKQIGRGGMGSVYQAIDRLTRKTVALKHVTISSTQVQVASHSSRADSTGVRMALAQEFKFLASMHHPHIINVLSYGFDKRQHPYFTMDYLEDAQTIIQAATHQPIDKQVRYLIQTLQALAYLHRRGIIHRDLKPGNILVSHNAIQVLDFGLSVRREAAQGRTGTVAYMAPEVVRGAKANERSDLYAVGTIAYQLFVGRHPFDVNSKRLMLDILKHKPDLSPLPLTLGPVIAKLLAKDPAERYPNAEAVIQALCAAIEHPIPKESEAIRESFLQAAPFIGREAELGQLISALKQATRKQGSAWLISGESGVGKSRLLDELRTQALVAGALVVRGQAIEDGGQPYQLWRNLLRRLILVAKPNDLEASILKIIVSDIGELLERPIPDPPQLNGRAALRRLVSCIINVIRVASKLSSPLVLLLEDLHWTDESLTLLNPLAQITETLPLLVVGSYCHDECPDLAEQLPGMQVLPLRRLEHKQIVELSTSILGEAGKRPQVLTLLEKETEGNIFFLVETVRALAEEAGQLRDIGAEALPDTVFAGGVRRIIQRRLQKVPAQDYPLLKLAAVSDRTLNLEMLQAIAPDINLEAWLTTCANLAILESHDGQWRFTHNKLRRAVLDNLDAAEIPALNRQIAEAYETICTNNDTCAPVLTQHWYVAGEETKAAHYARLAGEQAAAQFTQNEALHYFNRTLALTPAEDFETRYDLFMAREKIYDLLGQREHQKADLDALTSLLEQFNDKQRQAEVAIRYAHYFENIANYPKALNQAQQAVDLAQAVNNQYFEAEAYIQWGRIQWRQGYTLEARPYLEQSIALAQNLQYLALEAEGVRNLGITYMYRGEVDEAIYYFQQACDICISIGDKAGQSIALNNLGYAARSQGYYHQAKDYLEQALQIYHQIHEQLGQSLVLYNMGDIYRQIGDYEQAFHYFQSALQIKQQIQDLRGKGISLSGLSSSCRVRGDYEQSLAYAQQSLDIAREIKNRRLEGYALFELGRTLFALKRLPQALEMYQQCVAVRQKLEHHSLVIESLAALAQTHFAMQNKREALNSITQIIPDLQAGELGSDLIDPLQVYLTAYQILEDNQNPLAPDILQVGYTLLQAQAAKIKNEAWRQSYLQNVPSHQALLSKWYTLNKKASPQED